LPADDRRPRRDDVLAHSEVLQAILADHDVLPMSFGSVYPDGFDLAKLPGAQRRSLQRILDSIAGHVEMQVKATYDADTITHVLVTGDRRLRRMRETRQDYAGQIALGSRFAGLLDQRRGADAERVTKRLSRLAARVAVDPPVGEWGAFRLSFLVERRKLDDFERGLDEVAAELDAELAMTWVGPLPPYSFVQETAGRKAG
jgi:hypothetical protein